MSAIAIQPVRPSVIEPKATPEDVLRLEERGLYELVDGHLIEKQMSYAASEAAGKIAFTIMLFLKEARLEGSVLPEQSFQCFPHKPSQVRRPDVAYISASRVPSVRPDGHVKIVPDLAIEIISPNDNVYELDDKLADYRAAGIPLVWVVNPVARIIRVHRPDQPIYELRDRDVLGGDAVLPGFSAAVTALLPAQPAVAV